jgi:predicted lipoprotein with Yx(FWY)xxD motif
MKKNTTVIIGIVVILVVIIGGYAIFHKSPNMTASTSPSAGKSSAPAVNNAVLVTKTNASLGSYLAEPNGAALYTYNGDSSGVSTVTGSLLASWPAYQDTGSTSGLPSGVGTIKRTDNGQTQFTYNGMPLYTFVSDNNGQVTGNGVANFSVAKPAAAASSQSTTTAPASTPTQSTSTSSSYNPY